MAEKFEMPDDVTQLSDDALEDSLAAAVRSFKTASQTDVVTQSTLPLLRSLKASIQALKDERAARITAAEEAAAEIDQLSADVFGEDDETAEQGAADETEGETGEQDGAGDEQADAIEPTAVTASNGQTVRRNSLNLSAIRAKQTGNQSLTKYLPAEQQPGSIEIVASADVPGYAPGAGLDLSGVTEGFMRRASALKTSGQGTGVVASYTLPFSSDLVINDSSSAPEGSQAVLKAADQRRLDGGDLIASGGWCAPSETVYAIADIACPDMLWDAPEINLSRGGLRFFQTPTLDVNALTWIHTEQDDIAGNEKPCFQVPCPDPVEVRCDAIGICIEAGILTQRFFPELISWYVRNAMVAHEIRIKTAMYDAARAAATPVTMPATFASFSAVFDAVALQAADLIEKLSLCDSTALEVTFPWWLRNMFLSDLMRQGIVGSSAQGDAYIQDAFSRLGVRVQFARGLAPAVGGDAPVIGGPDPATAWPATVEFLLYPAGNFQIGRGASVDLGVVYDSAKFVTNDHTAAFSEECVALVDRGIDARLVTVPVCADGSIGQRTDWTCAAG